MFLKFFGFDEQPFGVTPDPRFLYMSAAHEEAFASLVYAIEMGRGFAALIASPGLGKTTVLLRLMERLQGSARTAFLFQTHLQSEEFLKSLITDLGVEPKSENLSDLQRQISDVLIEESRAGKRVVVAIDEAQNLNNSTLEMVRMLSNFETPQSKLLQIILVGQNELADKLARPELEQLRQRISIVAHFPPFPPAEVGKYIDHRLRTAGYKGGQLFTPAALRIIATQSEGIPRNINNLCFHALSLAFAKNQKVVTEAMLEEVLTDLNLHLLGTKRVTTPAPLEAPSVATAQIGGKEPPVAAGPAKLPEPPAPRPAKPPATSPLDAVNLSSHRTDREVARRAGQVSPVRNARPPRTTAHAYASPFRLVLLAAVLAAGFWARPWLEAGFNSLVAPIWHRTTSTPETTVIQDRIGSPAPSESSQVGSSGAETPAPAKEIAPRPVRTVAVPDETTPGHTATGSPESATRPGAFVPQAGITQAIAKSLEHPRQDPSVDDLGAHGPQGFLVVESSDSGAHISINGQSSLDWVTPHLFSLVRGVYNIKIIKSGYKPWTQQVRVDGSPEKWLVATLAAYREGGIFTVETDPPGMPVYVDGKPYGVSRVETELPAGWHVCEVVTGAGNPPLVTRFHLDSGEALTRRIRVTTLATPTGDVRPQPGEWNQTRAN